MLNTKYSEGYSVDVLKNTIYFRVLEQSSSLVIFFFEKLTKMKKNLKYSVMELMVMKKILIRSWSFSGLATMIRLALMYYVDFYSLFNYPQKIGKHS